MYVVETIPSTNEVIVGTKEEVFGLSCSVGRMNWFAKPEGASFRAHVKIRSQHQKAPATITLSGDSVDVEFEEAQDAITPGQGAVIYQESRVLGGGWIDRVS
jgi:tRNA-uridine 2-sulfurtransferase